MTWKHPTCMAVLAAIFLQLAGCAGEQATSSEVGTPLTVAASSSVVMRASQSASERSLSTNLPEEKERNHLTITVGETSFSASLADNEAAREFAAYLPMTVQMGELNGQEKFCDLPDNLPSDLTERPATIQSGDIMCWSGNTLVLFYSTFQNSYGGYVRLGTVDDPSGLSDALGSGSATVTWALTESK